MGPKRVSEAVEKSLQQLEQEERGIPSKETVPETDLEDIETESAEEPTQEAPEPEGEESLAGGADEPEETTEGEPEAEEIEAWGRKFTRQQFEEILKDSENVGRMAASHTRRMQELADQERELERRRQSFEGVSREVEHLRQLARSGPDGADLVAAYLRGEDQGKVSGDMRVQRLEEEVKTLRQSQQSRSSSAAVQQVEDVIRRAVSADPNLNDDPDTETKAVLAELLLERDINEHNWQDKVNTIIRKKSERQQARDRKRLDNALKAKRKATTASVPRSSGAASPTPRGVAKSGTPWVRGRKGFDVNFDEVHKRAIKFMEEREKQEG